MSTELRRKFFTINSANEYDAWVLECREHIRRLSNADRALPVGTRQKNFAEIACIKCLLLRAQRELNYIKSGAGCSNDVQGLTWEELDSAFRSRICSGMVVNSNYIEPKDFLVDAEVLVRTRIDKVFVSANSVKVNCVFNGQFISKDQSDDKNISTTNATLYKTDNFSDWYRKNILDVIIQKLSEFQERDSGWTLHKIHYLLVNINRFNPFHAGCKINLPSAITSRKALINLETSDNACFAWSVTAALYPAKPTANPKRTSSYPHFRTVLDVGSLTFPTTLKQIPKFEVDNDVSVNIFTLENEEQNSDAKSRIVPLQVTKKKRSRHANLLLVNDEQGAAHFMCIRNLSRLVRSQFTKRENAHYVCDRCLHYFRTVERLESHEQDCAQLNDNLRLMLPSKAEDRWVSFKNIKNGERAPFVVYADLECILLKVEQSNSSSSSSDIYQRHEPISVGYYLKSARDASLSRYDARRGADCIEWFVRELENIARIASETLSTIVPMHNLSLSEQLRHYNDPNCHICKKPFLPNQLRIRDHDHLTGRYRGPAHNNCNLNFKDSHVIPVIFHNLSGYDSHFIFETIANLYEGSVYLLPVHKEKYISFTKYLRKYNIQLRFIDSFKFMASSLNKLSSYLAESQLTNLRSQFSELSVEQFDLLTRKGIFPYDYVDSAARLEETALPPRQSFHNRLTDSDISEEAYNHAVEVWTKFHMRTLGEYSDLYLKTDVLLLADVFESFRDSCMLNYELDPAHYYTLPGFTWDAMLKHTGIRLELFTDVDMLLFVERGIRGGLSQCSHRYERANNRYMRDYDPAEPSKYLMYYDVNNLYGWAMCQPLPTHGFLWIEDAANLDVSAIPTDHPEGYILEVDLEYPRELHDKHADLPFCMVREKPPGASQEKLLATLNDKTRYVIHYRALQQCMRNGLVLKRIHRGLKFQQSTWLRDYIELNTRLRTASTNEFEKNLFKLMNNAVFGKTMENVRNRVDVRLATKWEGRYGAESLISKPNFHSLAIFKENLVAIQLSKLSAKFDKPIYVGMSILDISKICLYEFHYDYMLPTFGGKCRAMYTDTDSLIYSVECDDVYSVMKRDLARFDTSDYPDDNRYDLPRVNKKIPGLMKDENNGRIMTEFVGLRAKMYTFKVQDCARITKKAKGVKGYVIDRNITFDDYKDCLNNFTVQSRSQNLIRSKLHRVFSISQRKVALSPYDDKRFVTPDTAATLPWGHYSLKL